MSSSNTIILGTNNASQSSPLYVPTPSPLTTALPSSLPTLAPSIGFMLAFTITLKELGISNKEDKPKKPANIATKILALQVNQEDNIKGIVKAPKLTYSCPSSI